MCVHMRKHLYVLVYILAIKQEMGQHLVKCWPISFMRQPATQIEKKKQILRARECGQKGLRIRVEEVKRKRRIRRAKTCCHNAGFSSFKVVAISVVRFGYICNFLATRQLATWQLATTAITSIQPKVVAVCHFLSASCWPKFLAKFVAIYFIIFHPSRKLRISICASFVNPIIFNYPK